MQVITLTLAGAAIAIAFPASAQTPAPAVATPVVQPVAPTPVKMICKSSVETGSLIKQHKACFTAKQWRYVNDQHEAEARKLVEDGTGRPSGE